MTRAYRKWTLHELARLHKMKDAGESNEEIALHLHRSSDCVRERIKYENMSAEDKKAKVARARQRRSKKPAVAEKSWGNPTDNIVSPRGRPSQEMIADAARRYAAPRSLTSEFFGDPPRGYSALDRRQGA